MVHDFFLQKRMSGSEESPTRSSQRDKEISDSESYERQSSEEFRRADQTSRSKKRIF